MPKATIRARAPLRLGLAEGGTDVSPYADVCGGCVLNATIDRYACAVLRPLDEPRVRLMTTDQQREDAVHVDDSTADGGRLALHRAVYRHMVAQYNGGRSILLERSTCDAPVGSGLGSSPRLVVAMTTECLLRGDFSGLAESMRQGWEIRKRSAHTVFTPHLDDIYGAALEAGALAGKVSGVAGGGSCASRSN